MDTDSARQFFAARLNEILGEKAARASERERLVRKSFKVSKTKAHAFLRGEAIPDVIECFNGARALGVQPTYFVPGEGADALQTDSTGSRRIGRKRHTKAVRGHVVGIGGTGRRVLEAAKSFTSKSKLRSIPSTEAQNNFGGLIEDVRRHGEPIAITRFADTVAVVVPAEEYERMAQATARGLNLLTERYDAMFAEMQKPSFNKAIRSLFDGPRSKAAVANPGPPSMKGGKGGG